MAFNSNPPMEKNIIGVSHRTTCIIIALILLCTNLTLIISFPFRHLLIKCNSSRIGIDSFIFQYDFYVSFFFNVQFLYSYLKYQDEQIKIAQALAKQSIMKRRFSAYNISVPTTKIKFAFVSASNNTTYVGLNLMGLP
uniref:Uncharacterized protein n=1 Tax=Glossina brevipalpis TaxID=37001 RepID=A0A1A9X3H0_9MUSC